MSFVYKKLNLKDVIKTPFKVYKEWSFSSSSYSSNGLSIYSGIYSSSSIDTFTSGTIKYFQIDNTFYRNHYDVTKERILDKSINIVSIPFKKKGLRIQPGSLTLTSASITYIDDTNGNLYDSSFNTSSFVDNENRVFYIGNRDKFKYYTSSLNYSYTNTSSRDDSYYVNKIEYNNIQFIEGLYGSKLDFSGSSSVRSVHSEKYNFSTSEDFAWSTYLTIPSSSTDKQYLITKGATKRLGPIPVSSTVYGGEFRGQAETQYPYTIYYKDTDIYFEQFDGKTLRQVTSPITTGSAFHLLCQQSGSEIQLWITGSLIASSSTVLGNIENSADLFLGEKGDNTSFFSGSMEHIALYTKALNTQEIAVLSASIDNSPNIGNIFYEQGFITITKPGYQNLMNESLVDTTEWSLNYKSTVIITENEYLCTIKKDEFNQTMNPSARDSGRAYDDTVADFATGSYFSPYVTTIGLYNEDNELLAVGKLGQPVRMSDKTDTTFIIRFDT